jgi:tetratricopeptide (TPR) repeat protein
MRCSDAQRFREQHGDPGLAHTYNELGRYYFRIGDLARAHESLRRALELWRKADAGQPSQGGSDAIARGELNLGILLKTIGYQDRARRAFLRSRNARPPMARAWERAATYMALMSTELDLAEANSAYRNAARARLAEFGQFALATDGSPEAHEAASAYHDLARRMYLIDDNVSGAESSARASIAELRGISSSARDEREFIRSQRMLAQTFVESGRIPEGVAELERLRDALPSKIRPDIKIPVYHDLAWARGRRAVTLMGKDRENELLAAIREIDIAMLEVAALVRPRLPFTCGDLELEAGDDYQPVVQLSAILRLLLVSGRAENSGELGTPSLELVQGAIAALDLGQAADGAAITRGALFRQLKTDADRERWRDIERLTAGHCLEVRSGRSDAAFNRRTDESLSTRLAAAEASLSSEARLLLEEARHTATLETLKKRLRQSAGLIQYVVAKDATFAILITPSVVRVAVLPTDAKKLHLDVSAMHEGPFIENASCGVLGPSKVGGDDAGPTASIARAVRDVGQLFPTRSSKILEGSDATPAKVLLASREASLLHIGAHGEWGGDRVNTVEPFLTLVPDAKTDPDGFLTASKISDASLIATRIVLLSACKTTMDESPRFGTLAALPKGFFAAGANVVVGSLWSVEGDSTAELMQDFVKNAIAGASTAQALAKAQARIASDARWRHPFFWAAFEHLGPPISISLTGQ